MWHIPALEIPSCNIGKQCKVHCATQGNLSVLFLCWKSVVQSWIVHEPDVAIFNDPMLDCAGTQCWKYLIQHWKFQWSNVGNLLSDVGLCWKPMLQMFSPTLEILKVQCWKAVVQYWLCINPMLDIISPLLENEVVQCWKFVSQCWIL